MTTYSATFADGTKITRKSDRTYTAAWRSTWTDPEHGSQAQEGFSATPETAAKSAAVLSKYGVFGSPAQKAKARKLNAEYREACGYRVEIVPANAA